MPVSFNTIPQNLNTPLFYAEVDNSAANTATDDMVALIIAPKLSTAKGESNKLTIAGTAEQATEQFGAGSIMASMVKAYRNQDSLGTLYVVAVDDPTSGTAASQTITVSGTVTAAGTLNVYVNSTLVQVGVAVGDEAEDVASALSAAINAETALAVTAQASAGVVTVTSKHKGEIGNDLVLSLNLLGFINGQVTPEGLSVTFGELTKGTGVPDLDDALAALKDEAFEFIGFPFSDATSLDAIKTYMTQAWAYNVQKYGHVYSARRDTRENLLTFADSRNDEHISIFGINPEDPNTNADRIGATLGQAAVSVKADPARPFQTLELVGLMTPPASARFDQENRESLLKAGIATWKDTNGNTQIERAVTTYTENSYGAADNSYKDAQTLHTLGYIIRFLRTRITSKFGRHKLADDGTKFGEGQAIVTPSTIKAELVSAYGELEYAGLVENSALFKDNLIVERNTTDPNRVDCLLPPDLVNQFRIFAMLVQFRLQY
ncbi:MAG TPA: phage tail sheath subtilisin-like domain-containing protein [Candidatus Aphodousia faecavium]|nr:phage tail sheath subtilisin-like domain-containing protein [Candidatus Aphodousia faecavium]